MFEALVLALKLQNREIPKHFTIEAILAEGESGNRAVQELLDSYAYLLAGLCTTLIMTINPSLIILSGRIPENSHYLLEKTRHIVKQEMMNLPFRASSIVVGELKDQAGIKGAIALALQTIFEPPVTKCKNRTHAWKERR